VDEARGGVQRFFFRVCLGVDRKIDTWWCASNGQVWWGGTAGAPGEASPERFRRMCSRQCLSHLRTGKAYEWSQNRQFSLYQRLDSTKPASIQWENG
jgi:hypothetical protein